MLKHHSVIVSCLSVDELSSLGTVNDISENTPKFTLYLLANSTVSKHDQQATDNYN